MRSWKSPESRRWIEGSSLGAGLVLTLALFGIVNYFGWKYYQRFDWTGSRLYTLSAKSEGVLRALEERIDVVIFMSPGDPLYRPVRELLSRYEASSPALRVREVDPQKNLAEAQTLVDRYQIDHLNVVIFDGPEGRKVVDAEDLAEYDYSGLQMGQGPEMTGFKGEQEFTAALLELSERRQAKILLTTGHGELRLDDTSATGLSALGDLLRGDNFQVQEWPTLGQESVPEEADVVVIAGPTSTFVEPELQLLRGYLSAGGRLLVLLDPTLTPQGEMVETGLEALLREFGAEVGKDIVVDPANPLPFFGAETIFVDSYGDHPLTAPLRDERLPVIVPLARSVRAGEGAGLELVELMRTSPEGWGETDLGNLGAVELGDDDLVGPVSLALAIQGGDSRQESPEASPEPPAEEEASDGPPEASAEAASATSTGLRMVVVGDSDFASNGQIRSLPNETLLTNAVNWLAEREALVSIPAKKPEQVRLSLTRGQLSRVTWLVLILLPGLAIVAGVLVYLRRRR